MRFLLLYVSISLLLSLQYVNANSPEKTRLVIMADMGNEPDEEQQMVHMLMYANEFELQGLIAVTGKYLRKGPQPELFFKLIDGYDEVVSNLRKHADGWPDAAYLRSITVAGQNNYGVDDVKVGRSSAGSRLFIKLLDDDDERPIYVVVNAGSNTLAQALLDYEQTHSEEELKSAIAKLRVYENGAQDNAGAWICNRYPQINWIRSNYQTYCYGGPSIDGGADNRGKNTELGPYTWEPYAYNGLGQHQWALEHLKGNHGPLMALWPIRQFHRGGVSFLEGGGTIPWLGLVNKGLYDIEYPQWGGWSGRFSTDKTLNYWSKHGDVRKDESGNVPFYVYKEEPDYWKDPETGKEYNNIYAPIWRWRRAFFNDFVCRADWCIKPFSGANHNPVAAVDGDKSNAILFKQSKAGEKVSFDASESFDPDGDDIEFMWYFYPEASTYNNAIPLFNASQNKCEFTLPEAAKGKLVHLILEVKDKSSIASMYDYRRVIITVE